MKGLLVLTLMLAATSALANTNSLQSSLEEAIARSETDKAASRVTFQVEKKERKASWSRRDTKVIKIPSSGLSDRTTSSAFQPSRAQELRVDTEARLKTELHELRK